MNRKLVFVFAAAAFVLAACVPPVVDVSIVQKKKTSQGESVVTKHTETYYTNRDKTEVDRVEVMYLYQPAPGADSFVVFPCGGGFCDENGKDVSKASSSDSLDKKNQSVSRERRSRKGFASNRDAAENEGDVGGSSY